MRIVTGSKVVEAEPFDLNETRRIVIDVGSGDGRWVYESARSDPGSLYIGMDPDAAAPAEYASKARRKPERGGAANALFIVASLQDPPDELVGTATLVRVNFPWSGLLRGLIRPENDALQALGSLGRPDAHFEIVLCYDAEHDLAALEGEAIGPIDDEYIGEVLAPAYALAGLPVRHYRELSRDEALAIPSNWGRRVLHGGRRRRAFLLECEKASPGEAIE